MKSGKVILTIIGSWLLFIVLEVVSGRIARQGIMLLPKMVRLTYAVFGTARSMMLFFIAVVTFGLMVKHNSKSRRECGGSAERQE